MGAIVGMERSWTCWMVIIWSIGVEPAGLLV